MKSSTQGPKKTLRTALITLFLVASFQIGFAQIDLPDGSNTVDDQTAAPIDGLIGLGIAAGAYLGLRKKIKK